MVELYVFDDFDFCFYVFVFFDGDDIFVVDVLYGFGDLLIDELFIIGWDCVDLCDFCWVVDWMWGWFDCFDDFGGGQVDVVF